MHEEKLTPPEFNMDGMFAVTLRRDQAHGESGFLHNVTMASQNHNATLCKEVWGKNYWRKSRSVRVIV